MDDRRSGTFGKGILCLISNEYPSAQESSRSRGKATLTYYGLPVEAP
jgi:hypothetical protein